jgi:hypothetical protein
MLSKLSINLPINKVTSKGIKEWLNKSSKLSLIGFPNQIRHLNVESINKKGDMVYKW